MADIFLGCLFVLLALLSFLLVIMAQMFRADRAEADPMWKKFLVFGLVCAALAFLFFHDHAQSAAHLAIVLLPIHLKRAGMAAESYQFDEVPRWITKGVCRAFYEIDDDRPVVTFEGTRPDFLGDWLIDLNQDPLDLDPSLGRMPQGFGTAVFSVLLRMMKELPPDKPVDFNGHSMGGSNALIAAAAWKVSGRQIGRVTAFEPARVGRLGRVLAGEDVLITTCGADPVPFQPFWRDHPVEPVHLQPLPPWDTRPFDCHEIANVQAAIDAALRAPVRA